LDADSDDDGINDGDEIIFSLDPLNADSDGDVLNDGLEIRRTIGIPSGISDGLAIPFAGTDPSWVPDSDPSTSTDPDDADSDNDNIPDGDEDADLDGNVDITETDPVDADSDDDGISDGDETTFLLDPLDNDSDNDMLTDGLEIGRTTTTDVSGGTSDGAYSPNNVTYSGTHPAWTPDSDPATTTDPLDDDSDNDNMSDGNEDSDLDGNVDITETNPIDADTDDDGIKDGDEDIDWDGALDITETDPTDSDTDNDGLTDGLEKGYTTPIASGASNGSYVPNQVTYLGTTGWTPDSDPATITDARDQDTDDDGLLDNIEDADQDGSVDITETDPVDADTDDDGINDGDENPILLNPLDADSDDDMLTDGLEINRSTGIPSGISDGLAIAFTGTDPSWVPDSNPSTKTDPLDEDSDNDNISDGNEDADQDGDVDITETDPVDADSDDDGISDGDENTFLLDPLDDDSDNDMLNDGLEIGRTTGIPLGMSDGHNANDVSYTGTHISWTPDSDPATTTDARDQDTDNDGLEDGSEDSDLDGAADVTETDPLDADSDDDGINDGDENTFLLNPLDDDSDNDMLNDGLEIGRTTGIPSGTSDELAIPYTGTNPSWVPDSNNSSVTDPLDDDSDNDNISDGDEDSDLDGDVDITETDPVDADTDDDGINDYDEDSDQDGVLDPTETDPIDSDTDDDGLTDGLEKGFTTPIASGTSSGSYSPNQVAYLGTTGWTPDSDPATTTDERDQDSDDDNLLDGTEDSNNNGFVDTSESDPNNSDTDSDGSLDGVDCGNLNPNIYPGATDIPGNDLDENCDGFVRCYIDTDNDEFGSSSHEESSYSAVNGTSTISGACGFSDSDSWDDSNDDCDDTNSSINPDAVEICDNIDDNCDGIIPQDTENSISISSCDSYTAPDETVYTTSGIKTAIISNNSGCDSIITIDLTIYNSSTGTDIITACSSYTWIDSITYTESNNTATHTITNGAINGCDSIVTLNLTINNVITSTTVDNNLITADEVNATYQWINCGDNSIINSETNQSFTATTNGDYAVIINKNECVDTSDCVTISIIGIIENSFSKAVQLYPNPTNGNIYINLGNQYSDVQVNIININGELIKKLSYEKAIDIILTLEEKQGIYFIEIISEHEKAVFRVIKQ